MSEVDLITALRPRLFWIYSIFLIAPVFSLIFLISSGNKNSEQFTIGSQKLVLDKAETDNSRQKGLSGWKSLANKQGMLFIFDTADRQCMWMKDMKFSIDMIWVSDDKKIISIEKKVSPATYPETFCHGFARYVIELNSGASDSLGLKVGQDISI